MRTKVSFNRAEKAALDKRLSKFLVIVERSEKFLQEYGDVYKFNKTALRRNIAGLKKTRLAINHLLTLSNKAYCKNIL